MIDTDSDMIKHAKSELKFLRGDTNTEDEMQRLIEADILEIVRTFAKQGHSGSSASYNSLKKKAQCFSFGMNFLLDFCNIFYYYGTNI